MTADHVLPVALGGALHDPANGQGLCYPCHEAKTLAERQMRDTRRRLQG